MTTQTMTRPKSGTYDIDAAHSSVELTARHMMVTKVRGTFTEFSGAIDVGEAAADSSVTVEIDASTIDTRVEDRDNHLRSGDFLDVENHPTITFASTAIEHVEGDAYRMTGDLTVRGVTKPITIDFTYLGSSTDPWGQERALFEGSATFPREQWGLTWNQALESGGVLVSKEFGVELNVSAVLRG